MIRATLGDPVFHLECRIVNTSGLVNGESRADSDGSVAAWYGKWVILSYLTPHLIHLVSNIFLKSPPVYLNRHRTSHRVIGSPTRLTLSTSTMAASYNEDEHYDLWDDFEGVDWSSIPGMKSDPGTPG